MEAPDKIYIVETEAARGTILLACEEYNDFCKNHETQEYIRKDALLEWLEERLTVNMNKAKSRGCLHTIAANEDRELINKLNAR